MTYINCKYLYIYIYNIYIYIYIYMYIYLIYTGRSMAFKVFSMTKCCILEIQKTKAVFCK